uniref:Uncharacterized protein n=1 Tax=Picea glauca TaxID=3330 RepID=A0A101M590_PICGL|nr:hypothetical protein ABT39_MTgene906 [Picea glauca]
MSFISQHLPEPVGKDWITLLLLNLFLVLNLFLAFSVFAVSVFCGPLVLFSTNKRKERAATSRVQWGVPLALLS